MLPLRGSQGSNPCKRIHLDLSLLQRNLLSVSLCSQKGTTFHPRMPSISSSVASDEETKKRLKLLQFSATQTSPRQGITKVPFPAEIPEKRRTVSHTFNSSEKIRLPHVSPKQSLEKDALFFAADKHISRRGTPPTTNTSGLWYAPCGPCYPRPLS